jgi:hypothetical protein
MMQIGTSKISGCTLSLQAAVYPGGISYRNPTLKKFPFHASLQTQNDCSVLSVESVDEKYIDEELLHLFPAKSAVRWTDSINHK